jgi:hypothetical protein
MQPSISRIDLTQSPASIDAWPSIDWLTDDADGGRESEPATADRVPGPHGRGGLWAAMANAVARAREASTATARSHSGEVIDLVAEAPHLAYLARVACNVEPLDAAFADLSDADDL